MKRYKIRYTAIVFFTIMFSACQTEDPTMSLGIQDMYILPRMQKEKLIPAFTGQGYKWVEVLPDGRDSLVSTEKDYIFLKEKPGTYKMRFEIIDPLNYMREEITFVVIEEQVEYRQGITKVYEYVPAPGQFVNKMPEYEPGDTEEIMRRKAEENLSAVSTIGVSLGAYGGYITFGFDRTVMNIKGQRDFEVYGNSFYSSGEAKGGSNEPGIVMVSFDANMNGIPDDDWYELAGSEYYKKETIKEYEIAYFKPDPDKIPTPDNEYVYLNDTTYIRWESSQKDYGYISKNIYHDQSYWPLWVENKTITFKGTKLADNYYVIEGGSSTQYIQQAYDWGYVDNHPNSAEDKNGNKLCSFDIDWAVDKKGNKVRLPGVDFIRVYTGVNQYCGWLGETSTEIYGAKSLHVGRKY